MGFTPRPLEAGGHVKVLDPLRGIAALAVVLFHYTGSVLPTVRPNPLEGPFEIGRYGVHVFFVISGFVIPYALHRSGHRLKDLGRFLLRRYIRIAPPAYIAALAVILFHALAVAVTGHLNADAEWPGVNGRSVIGNLLFMPSFFGTYWFNFPYWTLMIEFQFYLVIGLMLPWLIDPERRWSVPILLIAFMLPGFLDDRYLFNYSPLFTMGILVFLHLNGTIGRRLFIPMLLVTAVLTYLFLDSHGLVIGTLTSLLILSRMNIQGRVLDHLGKISYSLYIIHVPVAYYAESVLKRIVPIHDGPAGRLIMIFVYTFLALLAASIFHRWLETPFMQLSKRLFRSPSVKAAAGTLK